MGNGAQKGLIAYNNKCKKSNSLEKSPKGLAADIVPSAFKY